MCIHEDPHLELVFLQNSNAVYVFCGVVCGSYDQNISLGVMLFKNGLSACGSVSRVHVSVPVPSHALKDP